MTAVLALLALPASASAANCGDGYGGPDYYDLRSESESCATARPVARAWAKSSKTNVFSKVTVRSHSCRGSRSSRRIKGVQTFKIVCRNGDRLAYWWIRPFH